MLVMLDETGLLSVAYLGTDAMLNNLGWGEVGWMSASWRRVCCCVCAWKRIGMCDF